MVAKSWKRIDDLTLEFELNDNLTFHNGDKLTADDVVYTINYISDPEKKFQFKTRYLWIKGAEKTGPYTVRVQAKKLYAWDLFFFAFRSHVLDSKLHATYQDPTEYDRRTPIGSGPYKVTKFDRNAGVKLERASTFTTNPYERAPIKFVDAQFIPDKQTQIAHLITSQLDLVFNVTPDQADALRADPNTEITSVDSLTGLYLVLDAIGRSDRKELMDLRVRKAMFMAIDRNALKALQPGGDVATQLNAMCFDIEPTCGYTTSPPTYDPAGAKKLLEEAGYPDGFPFVLDTQIRSRVVAEAIAGMWRKIGIRASINTVNTVVMFKRWQDGEMQGLINNAPAANWPDASYLLDINFGTESRDTIRDHEITHSIEQAANTHDDAERKRLYTIAFDRMNTLSSHLPISSIPGVWAHSKEVRIGQNQLSATRPLISDVFWK
jgi:peptide/nickel transport system substrate-binding protein